MVDFVPVDVGTYVMDVLAGGEKVSESPVLYKVYDASLIRITEANSGVVGQPCQFRLDSSQPLNQPKVKGMDMTYSPFPPLLSRVNDRS